MEDLKGEDVHVLLDSVVSPRTNFPLQRPFHPIPRNESFMDINPPSFFSLCPLISPSCFWSFDIGVIVPIKDFVPKQV